MISMVILFIRNYTLWGYRLIVTKERISKILSLGNQIISKFHGSNEYIPLYSFPAEEEKRKDRVDQTIEMLLREDDSEEEEDLFNVQRDR